MNTLKRFLGQEGAVTGATTGQLTVSILKRDGGQVAFDEGLEVTQLVMQELSSIAASGFGIPRDNRGVHSHVQDVDALLLLHDNTKILGFASALFPREGFLYLHGIVLSPEVKGKGGAGLLVRSLLSVCDCRDMAFSTQNPVMFCLLRSICHAVYPSPEVNEVPEHFWPRLIKLLDGRSGILDPKTGVRLNAYSQCLYPQIPESNDSSVNEWFSEKLMIEDGKTNNGFLFIGEDLTR